jgi:hypothetical protein
MEAVESNQIWQSHVTMIWAGHDVRWCYRLSLAEDCAMEFFVFTGPIIRSRSMLSLMH